MNYTCLIGIIPFVSKPEHNFILNQIEDEKWFLYTHRLATQFYIFFNVNYIVCMMTQCYFMYLHLCGVFKYLFWTLWKKGFKMLLCFHGSSHWILFQTLFHKERFPNHIEHTHFNIFFTKNPSKEVYYLLNLLVFLIYKMTYHWKNVLVIYLPVSWMVRDEYTCSNHLHTECITLATNYVSTLILK